MAKWIFQRSRLFSDDARRSRVLPLNSKEKRLAGYLLLPCIYGLVRLPAALHWDSAEHLDAEVEPHSSQHHALLFLLAHLYVQPTSRVRTQVHQLPRQQTGLARHQRHAHLRWWLWVHSHKLVERHGSLLSRALVRLDSRYIRDQRPVHPTLLARVRRNNRAVCLAQVASFPWVLVGPYSNWHSFK